MIKTALVTGANSGIGKDTSTELLKSGFHVIATMRDVRKKDALVNAANRLGLSEKLTVLKMDVTNCSDIHSAKEHLDATFGKLDVLVNNAGYCEGGFIDDLTFDKWSNQQTTNVGGTFMTINLFLPLLKKAKGSRIINISSVSGYMGFPGMSAYCASKFAIEGMSESLRLELMPKNIFVSLVQPASFDTNIWEKGLEGVNIKSDASSFQKNMHHYATLSAKKGSDPIEVATLIAKIARTKHPKFRYPIGKGARTLSLIKRFLPWCVIEWVVRQKLK